jgi:hypothetical protein
MSASLPAKYKYEELPRYEAEPSPISRSTEAIDMPYFNRISIAILPLLYAAPIITSIACLSTGHKEAPCATPSVPTLYTSLISGLSITALGLLFDYIRDEFFGIEHDTSHYRTFQQYKIALLYDITFLVAGCLSIWATPQCPA